LKIVEWLRSGYIALHPDPVLNRLTAAETSAFSKLPDRREARKRSLDVTQSSVL
jgi:hypothetical protein